MMSFLASPGACCCCAGRDAPPGKMRPPLLVLSLPLPARPAGAAGTAATPAAGAAVMRYLATACLTCGSKRGRWRG